MLLSIVYNTWCTFALELCDIALNYNYVLFHYLADLALSRNIMGFLSNGYFLMPASHYNFECLIPFSNPSCINSNKSQLFHFVRDNIYSRLQIHCQIWHDKNMVQVLNYSTHTDRLPMCQLIVLGKKSTEAIKTHVFIYGKCKLVSHFWVCFLVSHFLVWGSYYL